MTWATVNDSSPRSEAGEARLIDAALRSELEAAAAADGFLLVPIEPPRPAFRGRLALLVETAVEAELERRGAPPPGVGASSDLDASLSDQLYRARLVGHRGLVISISSLEGIANLAGALDAEDSAVVRWWIAATRERPVRLLLSRTDRDLGIYGEPLSLETVLGSSNNEEPCSRERIAPTAAPEVVQSAATMDLSEPPPSAVERAARIAIRAPEPTPPPPPAPRNSENDAEALMRAMAVIFEEEPEETEHAEPTEVPPSVEIDDDPETIDLRARAAAEATLTATDSDVPSLTPPSVEAFVTPEPETAHEEPVAEAPVADAQAKPQTEDEHEHEHEGETSRVGPPLDPNAARDWQRWMRELDGARGPKPLAVIERLFVSAYVPLADAVERGIAGPEAGPVLAAWAKSFEKSYSEAFDALRVRGKRPTMVLDVPDLALRIGRLHGARAGELVLVDGMRFDLGIAVNERLKTLLGSHAVLTERLLLWAALPSSTEMQLELIGRGPQGLKEISETSDSEVPVARGRAAATFRRIRTGQRELLKLDLVESAMSVPGGPLPQRLDDLADETAEALANHLLHLPARTLAVVFGDHGFTIERMGGGTSAAHSGGAAPEQVLVPAFAWLVGSVH